MSLCVHGREECLGCPETLPVIYMSAEDLARRDVAHAEAKAAHQRAIDRDDAELALMLEDER